MPKLESNEFYNTDLIGSHVLSETDECFGEIQRVLETKTGTILEITPLLPCRPDILSPA